MERKYIFFDIDGTLLDDNPGGKILESTYRTLDKLKENGHFVAIATGRAQYMAMDAAKEAHIGEFDLYMCEQLICESMKILRNNHIPLRAAS